MTPSRLSPLDTSFLRVESPTAHMHVGWVALFSPPANGSQPSFAELRAHIGSRLCRAPRYRQRLAEVPLGVHSPIWVDDEQFDLARHVRYARGGNINKVVEKVMSTPLDPADPLWQIWVADKLSDGRIGIVGKAHHCMVDGIAAVELASLLLDPTREPPPPEPDNWEPQPAPTPIKMFATGLRDRVTEELDLFRVPARLARQPRRVLDLAEETQRAARALTHSFKPSPASLLNRPISPLRHLARSKRPLDDLKQIKGHFRTSINDVVLAASSGGVRRFMERRGERPTRLKTMVPVSLRDVDKTGEFGNRISFVFVDLPCDEPDPVRRLLDVHMSMTDRKRAGEPQGGDHVLRALKYAPHGIQNIASKLIASPRAFNLTVSNIPGPADPVYMKGCELEEAYPVVPLADSHAVSIGITTIKDGAFFGVYADRETMPDADLLAEDIDESIEELIAHS
jgi:WS/DGAT/MGAT family acyltransferase